jgi:hypothetical protein
MVRQTSTRRLATVTTISDVTMPYVVLALDDGEALAIPGHELDAHWTFAAGPGEQVLTGERDGFTFRDHTGRIVEHLLTWTQALILLRTRFDVRGVGRQADTLRASRVEPVVLGLATVTVGKP